MLIIESENQEITKKNSKIHLRASRYGIRLINIMLLSLGLIFCSKVHNQKEKYQCYWMENISGQFEWIPANSLYQKELTKMECFELDSCDGGLGYSGGGCYKWATSAKPGTADWSDIKR